MLTDDLIATLSRAQAAFTERVHAVAPVIDRLVALTGRPPRPA